MDDLRYLPSPEWELARTNTDAIRALATGMVEEISLDHDIYFIHPYDNIVGGIALAETFKPVAYYIALMPEKPKVLFHTANIPAGEEMARIIGVKFEHWMPV